MGAGGRKVVQQQLGGGQQTISSIAGRMISMKRTETMLMMKQVRIGARGPA